MNSHDTIPQPVLLMVGGHCRVMKIPLILLRQEVMMKVPGLYIGRIDHLIGTGSGMVFLEKEFEMQI